MSGDGEVGAQAGGCDRLVSGVGADGGWGAVHGLALSGSGGVEVFSDAVGVDEPGGHAGGGACPIRFQCAGCGFYRPDPSYLPAMQEHIASLRADLETARAIGAADYVTANLAAQIDAFTTVADTMHHRLSELGSDERAEVEQASRLLRRARAGRRLPLTVNPTPTTQTG